MNELINRALAFAAEKHCNQVRKNGKTPYILHPLEVAAIAGTLSSEEELLAAALLHDTLEDTSATEEELRALFGDRVTALVLSETEDKMPDLPREASWKLRKERQLKVLEQSDDPAVKMLWLSDKVSNLRSFYRMYREEGSSFWNHFHEKNPSVQRDYYRNVYRALSSLAGSAAYEEYGELCARIFQETL